MAQQPTAQKPLELADQVSSAIPPNLQKAFVQVVQAGMKVMFSDETHELMLDTLQGEGDVGENIGQAMAMLMGLLFEKSNGKMPGEVIVPAGLYLLAKGASFIEDAAGVEITPDILATATDTMLKQLMGMAGGDPEKLGPAFEQAAAKAGQMQQGGAEDDEEEE